jgi:hypothetical protein
VDYSSGDCDIIQGVSIPSSVAEFRSVFQQEQFPRYYSSSLHLLLTVGASLTAAIYCVFRLKDVRPLEWLTIPVTFLYANLTEYVAHRYPMHRPMRGLKRIFAGHTLNHHHYFTHESMEMDGMQALVIILFPPVMLLFFFGLFGFPVAFLLGSLISTNVGYLFLAVAMGYYFNYELFHLAYHMPQTSFIGRLPVVKKLRLLHTRHHDLQLMTGYCFNITYPLCDFLFGTLTPRVRSAREPLDG